MNALRLIQRRLVLLVLIGTVVFAGLFVWADFPEVTQAFADFQLVYLIPILALAIGNYGVRYIKWNYLLKQIDLTLAHRDSVTIFLSGLAMSITPGKLGELFKSHLIQKLNGEEMSRTMPVVMVERLTDAFALVLLASVGVTYFQFGLEALGAILAVLLLFTFAMRQRAWVSLLMRLGERIAILKRIASGLLDFYLSSRQMLALGPLLVTTLLSVISWGFECVAMYLVFQGLGTSPSLLVATFIFAFATIVGTLSMLPGGIGAADGSMAGLMVVMGLSKPLAVTATLIIRAATLWFGVIIGLGILAWNWKRFELQGTDTLTEG